MDRFVTMYLDYAEDQAERKIPMNMEDWAKRLNAFLKFNEREILDNPGKVSQEVAKAFAESEFEIYRIVQDQLFQSDFDRHIQRMGTVKESLTVQREHARPVDTDFDQATKQLQKLPKPKKPKHPKP